ncbi:hypothetical protein EWM64_g6159 [Hericium alpestre]|uniref:Uncharacterized protein n=1 Tax=Hericium alpestre TaxID=135208 RepID=A0A4Y9ZUD3_9AGAM|nr:hypothetical protein EWM64_g6159 [Hericium alpestre]
MLATAFIVLFFSAQCLLALANTEIINFAASQDVDALIPEAATWQVHSGYHHAVC